MGIRPLRFGADDVKDSSCGMPSFDPPEPISDTHSSEGNQINSFPFSDIRTFDQSIGFRLEHAIELSTKASGQAVFPDSFHTGRFQKSPTGFGVNPYTPGVSIQRPLQPEPVSIPSGSAEHGGESNMADDVSTDADTDHRDDGSNRGQLLAAASDSSDRSKDKLDQKTLRRLAQNREAARKSRLRKKAYVQQLENSRLKLTQLEQELQKARQQGIFISSAGDQANSAGGNGPMAFDLEYARWLEEKNRQTNELRSAINSHAGDAELRIIVDGIMAHYEELFRLRSNAAKNDVFHLLSGMWKTPAERCFLWLAGFRSSELLKLLVNQLEPLTEQQLVGISNLQQSSQQAEDALSQGMEALQQSLAETLCSGSLGSSGSSGNVANYMGQMAMAMGKLGTLEGFVRQADNLRQQTLQQMLRILTTRQSARALLAMHDYFSRLRALSSLWLARPKE